MTKTINFEIDEEILNEAMRRAGTSEPRHALAEAIKQYTRPTSQKDLIKYLGTFDDFMTPEELDEMRRMG